MNPQVSHLKLWCLPKDIKSLKINQNAELTTIQNVQSVLEENYSHIFHWKDLWALR